MKRLFFTLLILAMITPALTCVIHAYSIQAQSNAHCHQDSSDSKSMLDMNCAGFEAIALNPNTVFKAPNGIITQIDFDRNYIAPSISRLKLTANTSHAPPDIYNISPLAKNSLIITTGRFRV